MKYREFWLLSAPLSGGLFILLQILVLFFSERGSYLWYAVAGSWFLLTIIFLHEFFKRDDEEAELERYGIEMWNARIGPPFLALIAGIFLFGMFSLIKWKNGDLVAAAMSGLGVSAGTELAALIRSIKRKSGL